MQDFNPILGPAAVIATWLVVMFFICVTRVMGSDVKLADLPPGFRGPVSKAEAPDKMKWTRHNYEHLMEQPTAFYALVIILAIVGDTSAPSLYAAWTYAIARIVHSFWQMQVNTIPVRFLLFMIATLALAMLGVHAVMFTLL